jgi:hypothetical protein
LLFTRKCRHAILAILKICIQIKTARPGTPCHGCFFVAPQRVLRKNSRLADTAATGEQSGKITFEEERDLKKEAITQRRRHKQPNKPKSALRIALWISAISTMSAEAVFAATIWEKANEIMKDVYNQILLISTIAAIVTASVALLLMNFSRSGKTVDESRSWLKRIIVTWVILNGLGFIMSYITPFFTGGKWTG